jgi:hypothetical protein
LFIGQMRRGGFTKYFLAAFLAIIALGDGGTSFAEPIAADDVLGRQESMCLDNIANLQRRLDWTVFWGNVSMLAGAATAALGSALAGFLGTDGQRRSAAVVGALGAVLTVVPRALPDKTELHSQLANADKHHTVGAKFRNQFAFARADESLTQAQKYVSARFTDCAAREPPASVPDLPSSEPTTATARNFQGAGTDTSQLVQRPQDVARQENVAVPSPSATTPIRFQPRPDDSASRLGQVPMKSKTFASEPDSPIEARGQTSGLDGGHLNRTPADVTRPPEGR